MLFLFWSLRVCEVRRVGSFYGNIVMMRDKKGKLSGGGRGVVFSKRWLCEME